jgi:hypothetical protein
MLKNVLMLLSIVLPWSLRRSFLERQFGFTIIRRAGSACPGFFRAGSSWRRARASGISTSARMPICCISARMRSSGS